MEARDKVINVTPEDRNIACEILRCVFIHGLGAVGKLDCPESVERVAKILAMNQRCRHETELRAGVKFCMLASRNQSLHDDMADFCESSEEISKLWHQFKIEIGRI